MKGKSASIMADWSESNSTRTYLQILELGRNCLGVWPSGESLGELPPVGVRFWVRQNGKVYLRF